MKLGRKYYLDGGKWGKLDLEAKGFVIAIEKQVVSTLGYRKYEA
jgi:hypothetical protein